MTSILPITFVVCLFVTVFCAVVLCSVAELSAQEEQIGFVSLKGRCLTVHVHVHVKSQCL